MTPGTTRQAYSLEEEDLDALEEKGVEIDRPILPVSSIEVLYAQNSDNYASLSVKAETYAGLARELATHSGYLHEDDLNWGEIRRKLQELDGT